MLGIILATVTVGIPLLAVLSFSTPPRSVRVRVSPPLTINVVTQDDTSTIRPNTPPQVADR